MKLYIGLFVFFFVMGLGGGMAYRNWSALKLRFEGYEIKNFKSELVSDSSAVLSFSTRKPVTVKVSYGTTMLYGLETPELGPADKHEVSLQGLLPGREHHFMITMKDSEGKEYTSGNYTLRPAK